MNQEEELEQALQQYGHRLRFQQQLAQAEDTLLADHRTERAAAAQSGQIRALWQTYRTTLAVAASVALVTTFFSIFLYRSYQQSHQQQAAQYSLLSKEIQAVKTSQRQLMKNLTGQTPTPVNPAQVGGTGFLLTTDGYMVTSNHTVQRADSVYVQSPQGQSYRARVVFNDPSTDLAILQVTNPTAFRASNEVPYTFSERVSDLGERVFTLGFPRDEVVYSEGYVSSATGYQSDTTAYQVAISVNPGNSGGPLLNDKGHVVGIISGKQTTSEGVSFAVRADYLLRTLAHIPADSLKGQPVRLNHRNTLAGLSRTQQIRHMKACVYQVSVYKH